MATTVYPSFEANIDRAEALIRIFKRGRKAGRPGLEDTQLTRSSLVFSIGALDAYLHDIVLLVVAEHAPPSEDLDKALKRMDAHDIVQTMIRSGTYGAAQVHFRGKLDVYFKESSFMDVNGLQRAMRLVGCANLTMDEFAARTGRPALAEDLGRFTDQRHRIIHRGHKVVVHKPKSEDAASMVRSIVNVVDAEVDAKFL